MGDLLHGEARPCRSGAGEPPVDLVDPAFGLDVEEAVAEQVGWSPASVLAVHAAADGFQQPHRLGGYAGYRLGSGPKGDEVWLFGQQPAARPQGGDHRGHGGLPGQAASARSSARGSVRIGSREGGRWRCRGADFQVRVIEVLQERGLQIASHHAAAGADALAQPRRDGSRARATSRQVHPGPVPSDTR